MAEIKTFCGKTILVDDCDFNQMSKYVWRLNSCGYPMHGTTKRINGKRKSIKVLIHRALMDVVYSGMHIQVDHINGNKLDNRRSNLRLCNNSQNNANRELFKTSTSGFKGTSWHKKDKKWRSYISFNNKSIHLGNFNTKEEAAKQYDIKAKELFGEFAILNFRN